MIEKYVNENVLLIPNTVYWEKDKYDFKWIIDSRFKLTGFASQFSFDKPGSHKIQLIVTDTVTQLSSTFNNFINVKQAEQKYAPAYINNSSFGYGEFGFEGFGDQ